MKEPIEALKQLCPSTHGINGIERSENQHDGVPTPFKRGHIANAMLEARLLSTTLADRKSGLRVLIQLMFVMRLRCYEQKWDARRAIDVSELNWILGYRK